MGIDNQFILVNIDLGIGFLIGIRDDFGQDSWQNFFYWIETHDSHFLRVYPPLVFFGVGEALMAVSKLPFRPLVPRL